MENVYSKLQETDFSAVVNIDCPNLSYRQIYLSYTWQNLIHLFHDARIRHGPNLLEESLGSHLIYLLHLLIKKKNIIYEITKTHRRKYPKI